MKGRCVVIHCEKKQTATRQLAVNGGGVSMCKRRRSIREQTSQASLQLLAYIWKRHSGSKGRRRRKHLATVRATPHARRRK